MNEIYYNLFINSLVFDFNNKTILEKYKEILITSRFIYKFKEYVLKNDKISFIDENIKENIYRIIDYIRDNCLNSDKKYIYENINEIIVYLNKLDKKDPIEYYFYETIQRNIDPCFSFGEAKYIAQNNRKIIYITIKSDFEILHDLKKETEEFKKIYEKKYKIYDINSMSINYPSKLLIIFTLRKINIICPEILEEIKINVEYLLEQYKHVATQNKKNYHDYNYIELLQAIRSLEVILKKDMKKR